MSDWKSDRCKEDIKSQIKVLEEKQEHKNGCDLCNDEKIVTVRCYMGNGNTRWRDLPKFCPMCGKDLNHD